MLLHLQRENASEHTKPRALPWADSSLALQAAFTIYQVISYINA